MADHDHRDSSEKPYFSIQLAPSDAALLPALPRDPELDGEVLLLRLIIVKLVHDPIGNFVAIVQVISMLLRVIALQLKQQDREDRLGASIAIAVESIFGPFVGKRVAEEQEPGPTLIQLPLTESLPASRFQADDPVREV